MRTKERLYKLPKTPTELGSHRRPQKRLTNTIVTDRIKDRLEDQVERLQRELLPQSSQNTSTHS